MTGTLAALCGALLLGGPGLTPQVQVRGDYIEARTADVYTGPCFSNAEVFITGDKAVMAWKITEGSYNGVELSGLCVAAALKGTTTFSEDNPAQARSVLIVDQDANPEQRDALVALAKHLSKGRLDQVADVKSARIALTVESAHAMTAEPTTEHSFHKTPQAPRASLWVPGLAEILTRPFDEGDHTCGNEVVAYPPLSSGVDALPAYTLSHHFRGEGLNANWNDPNCRSSFVGHFTD